MAAAKEHGGRRGLRIRGSKDRKGVRWNGRGNGLAIEL